MLNLRPIYTMRFVITCCSIQLILHRVNAKVAPTSVKEVNETRLSPREGSTSCYCKSYRGNWPLIDFYLVLHCQDTTYKLRLSLSLLNNPALVNDYWKVMNTAVTDGSKRFLYNIAWMTNNSYRLHSVCLVV